MRITGLVPALRNPRKHELDELRRSVERFGFTTPCIIDERTGRLVAGHGRVQLLQIEMEAGSQRPEGVQQDADGEWMVPVLAALAQSRRCRGRRLPGERQPPRGARRLG
jgi:hypothetical protein